MDLEQRVKVLEEEIQILKGQIQASLLDIQEQLLNGAHPTLRTSNSDNPDDPAPQHRPSVVSFTTTPVEATAASNPAPEAPLPSVRKVTSVDQLGTGWQEETSLAPTPAAPKTARKSSAAPASKEVDWTTLAALEGWASEQVGRIGARRTRELIRRYAEEGRFNRKVRDDLLRLVATYEEVIAERDSRETAVVSARTKTAPEQPTAKKSGAAVPVQITPAPQKPTPKTPARTTAEVEKVEGRSQMVLRLIAGVHNASAGVQWRKRNG
ncbi:MAG: hypothetical protein SF029_09485 [bacterium]|nr:hypothetical protein [bacterium]